VKEAPLFSDMRCGVLGFGGVGVGQSRVSFFLPLFITIQTDVELFVFVFSSSIGIKSPQGYIVYFFWASRFTIRLAEGLSKGGRAKPLGAR
jgi:hypothetical protein